MKKSIIVIVSLMTVVLAGSGMFMNKKDVKADVVPKVEQEVTRKGSTVVGNLDIVKLYMNDY
jgi:hypothetical protein